MARCNSGPVGRTAAALFWAGVLAIYSAGTCVMCSVAWGDENNCIRKSSGCTNKTKADCGSGSCDTGGSDPCTCQYSTVAQACRCYAPVS